MSSAYFVMSEVKEVTEETQASICALTEVDKFFSAIGQSDERTKVHDQKDTNLCHSYALMSALRMILTKLFEEKIQDSAKRNELLDSLKQKKQSSFYKMLAVFIGSINPRTFDSMFEA